MALSEAQIKVFRSAYGQERPVKERLGGVYDLLRYGFVDNARQVIAELKPSNHGGRINWLDTLCERTDIYHRLSFGRAVAPETAPVDGLPQPITFRKPTDVMILHAPGATRLVISFGGANSAFWLPAALTELPNTNVIALRDARRLFHLVGVVGLSGDYQGTVTALQKLIAKLGAKEVITAGCSSGGYAALRYGLDLNASGVLGISAPTGSDIDLALLAEQHPGVRKLVKTKPEMVQDVVPLYRQHPNPPKVILAWGEKHAFDNEQAMRMHGLPNVTLVPIPGVAQHSAWVKLSSEQDLDPLVRRLFAA